ncbi:MAG: domain protein beta Propeller [Bryobacterales bacterium]|nr:domain protein beta Propeller [Bryobacterales bacterium]
MRGTRRTFLATLATSALHGQTEKGKIFPSEWKRYSDPATEFEVYRLTNPTYSSQLPAYYNRTFSRRSGFLLFSSDRTGSRQAFRMDLKSGECRQLTQAENLDGASLTLLPDDQTFCVFDGPSLRQITIGTLRDRQVYRVAEGWTRGPGASVTADGASAILSEVRDQTSRLRRINIGTGAATTVVETAFPAAHPVARPRRAQVLYRQGDEALWLVNLDGRQNHRLKTAADGAIGAAFWSPNGRTVLYLHIPTDTTKLIAIREHTPDENLDKTVSPTSQFAHFGSNGDTSVFVGASRNRNSPHILILLRMTRRELTLCEHRSSDPSQVTPMFSPDSQRVFFQSDREGKPALYRVRVERFVEETVSGE